MGDDGPLPDPVRDDQIICEGFLRVRAEKGIAGLRPWLLR